MGARPALPSVLLVLLFLLFSALDLASSDIPPSPLSGGPVPAPASPTTLTAPAMGPSAPSPASPTPLTAPSMGPSAPSPASHTPSPAPAMGPSAPSPAFSPENSDSPPAPPVAPASSPSPTPSPANGVVRNGEKSDEHAEVGESSSGMSGGKKAAIAVGVLSAAAVVGLGALVYKKRRDNIRRSRYGYATRREML
ncbi:uncharacterized protein [Elaeis guineensis]|uniref:uncharacterized protein n=1 Tax=Elaeis guineensis var. tenera TaxID=51953 RepID=UPI000579D71E